jgi:site-specific recombinase XerD
MSRPSRVRVVGPLASFAEGFAAQLARQGYRPNAAANQLQLLAHLSRWLASEGLDAAHLSASVLDEFLVARRAQGYTLWLSPKALAPFVSYLHSCGITVAPSTAVSTPAEELLARYGKYLIDTRGLIATSARGYVHMVRPFVASREVDGALEWISLQPGGVIDFVRSICHRRSIGSAKLAISALRSLLGYLHLEGLISSPLAAAVPSVAGWKLAGLPKSLKPNDVERLLRSCDRRRRTGRRDFAILMLLARLGLRAGEVRGLGLEDIDWRAGELIVRGKGDRAERLPLTPEVGQAIASYLRRGRPLTAQARTVFVRVHAPHRALSATGVTQIVVAAASRADLGHISAHRLRHTVATQMLRAGVSLPEVSQVLRHRRLMTTAIYAKVDREGLRRLARPWPGEL